MRSGDQVWFHQRMKRSLTTVIQGGLAVAGATILVSCGTASDSAETTSTTPDSTTSTAPTTSVSPSTVTDVEPAQFQFAPDRFRFAVDGTPRRECVLSPGISASERTVTCSVPFPAGTPEVTVPPFGSGKPNAVVLGPQGYYSTIIESGPPGAALLTVNSRLTVGNTTCTAISGGFECAVGENAVRYVDGAVTLAGAQATVPTTTTEVPSTISTTTPPPANDAPMDVYTDSTTPAAPGTTCGAATGRRVVTVVSGPISCSDAIAVMDTYWTLPADGNYGNANIRQFDGWSCSAPTAVRSRELGYGSRCSKDDVTLTTPLGAF